MTSDELAICQYFQKLYGEYLALCTKMNKSNIDSKGPDLFEEVHELYRQLEILYGMCVDDGMEAMLKSILGEVLIMTKKVVRWCSAAHELPDPDAQVLPNVPFDPTLYKNRSEYTNAVLSKAYQMREWIKTVDYHHNYPGLIDLIKASLDITKMISQHLNSPYRRELRLSEYLMLLRLKARLLQNTKLGCNTLYEVNLYDIHPKVDADPRPPTPPMNLDQQLLRFQAENQHMDAPWDSEEDPNATSDEEENEFDPEDHQ